VAREVARATFTRVVSCGGGGGVRRVALRVEVVVVFFLAVVIGAFFLAGARPDDEARVPEERWPDAPWREDPARPLGRGLRLVAVTVPERYPAPPADPGSPARSILPPPAPGTGRAPSTT
jgi:hypothetical protein